MGAGVCRSTDRSETYGCAAPPEKRVAAAPAARIAESCMMKILLRKDRGEDKGIE